MQLTISDPTPKTEVLLLHAPYPGTLKFEGQPSGLLAAVAPLAHRLAAKGRLPSLGLFDPGCADDAYRKDLRAHLLQSALRVLCVSTSTAAIEETAAAVRLARECCGERLLIIVGGPHEDDCDEKAAHRIPGVDLSIGGECEFVLARVLELFLAGATLPEHFMRSLPDALAMRELPGGRVTLASPWWGKEALTLQLPRLLPAALPEPVWSWKRPRFSVFEAPETIPLMLSRGCPYGRCTFCSEPNRDGVLVRQDFRWIESIANARPDAALYFQDSIMPLGDAVERSLLPLLKDLGRPWGCQVYLPTLSRASLGKLAAHGCRYLYTGLESGAFALRAGIGKPALEEALVFERLRWGRDFGLEFGISLMFGALSIQGELLETEATIAATLTLAERIVNLGVRVSGFYPNVLTVLPGTRLAQGLAKQGFNLDFYRMSRSPMLEGFEDGSVGYNFTTIPALRTQTTILLAKRIVEAGKHVQQLGERIW